MSQKRLDIIVMGATGFSGRYTVINLFKLFQKYGGFSWGIAGRNSQKLQNLLQDLTKKGTSI